MASSRVWPTALLAAFIAAGVTWTLMRTAREDDASAGHAGPAPGRPARTGPEVKGTKPRSAADLKLDPGVRYHGI